jgi:predicted transcriptional regulator
MKLSEFVETTGFEVLCLPDASVTVEEGYTSDLLSDVVSNCPEDSVLITVQNHTNSIAVCTLVEAVAIVITHDREITQEMIELARQEEIALFRTPLSQFQATCVVASVLNGATE